MAPARMSASPAATTAGVRNRTPAAYRPTAISTQATNESTTLSAASVPTSMSSSPPKRPRSSTSSAAPGASRAIGSETIARSGDGSAVAAVIAIAASTRTTATAGGVKRRPFPAACGTALTMRVLGQSGPPMLSRRWSVQTSTCGMSSR